MISITGTCAQVTWRDAKAGQAAAGYGGRGAGRLTRYDLPPMMFDPVAEFGKWLQTPVAPAAQRHPRLDTRPSRTGHRSN